MPRPLTPAQLLAAADAADAEAADLEVRALARREQARMLRATAAVKGALTMGSNRGTPGSNVQLDLSDKDPRVKNAGSRTRKGSAAKQAMLLAGKTDADAAKACKVGRSTVNAWVNGTRQIPAVHQATLAAPPFNIPKASWPRRE